MKIVKKYQTPDGPIQPQEEQPVQQKKRHGLWWHMMHPIRKRLYKNLAPYNYNVVDKSNIRRVWDAVVRNRPDDVRSDQAEYQEDGPTVKDALWARYLNLDNEDVGYNISDYVEESPYTYNGHKAYRLKPETAFTQTTPQYTEWYSQDAILNPNETNYGTYNSADLKGKGNYYDKNLGRYDYGRTSDYVWYHDRWDLNPYRGSGSVQNVTKAKLYDLTNGKRMHDPYSYYSAQMLGMSERKYNRFKRKKGADWINQQFMDRGLHRDAGIFDKVYGRDYGLKTRWSWRNLFSKIGDFSFGIGKPFHLYDRYYTNE